MMVSKMGAEKIANPEPQRDTAIRAFFSFRDLAMRWRCSRASVYSYIRGYPVIDFARIPGRKGHKLVSYEVVRQIEQERSRVVR